MLESHSSRSGRTAGPPVFRTGAHHGAPSIIKSAKTKPRILVSDSKTHNPRNQSHRKPTTSSLLPSTSPLPNEPNFPPPRLQNASSPANEPIHRTHRNPSSSIPPLPLTPPDSPNFPTVPQFSRLALRFLLPASLTHHASRVPSPSPCLPVSLSPLPPLAMMSP
jgi:hypothetical protein